MTTAEYSTRLSFKLRQIRPSRTLETPHRSLGARRVLPPQPRYARIDAEHNGHEDDDARNGSISASKAVRSGQAAGEEEEEPKHDRQQKGVHNLDADAEGHEVNSRANDDCAKDERHRVGAVEPGRFAGLVLELVLGPKHFGERTRRGQRHD